MEFLRKNILITGLIVFLIISLGATLYLTQRQTQLKSRAAGPTGTCNGDNTFCLWFDTLTADQPTEGKDLYVFVVGKNGDTNVQITGDFNSSSAEILSGASCGSADFDSCWKFTINGSSVTSGAKNAIFKSTEAPDGRVGGWVTILAAAAPPPPGGSPSCKTQTICGQSAVGSSETECKKGCDGTKAKYDCTQSDNSNCTGTIYCAAKNSDCAATPPACKTQTICGQSAVGSSETECKKGCDGTKAKYDCTQSDNSNCTGTIYCAAKNSDCAGGNPPGGTVSGSDVADCEVVTVNGQSLSTFPGMVVNNPYRVDMVMRNTKVDNTATTNWTSSYKIKFIGGPSALTELGVDNSEFSIGKTIVSGDQIPFTVLLKPKSTGTYPFKWQMYNAQGQPFGGICQPNFTVFTTLPGVTAPPTALPSPNPNATVQFRVANGDSYELAVAGLDTATWVNFSPTANSTFMLSPVTLTNPQSGKAKFVALQFKKGDAIDNNIVVKSILFLGAPPAITGAVNCEYTADSTSTRVIINGQNLGAAGSVSSNSTLAYKIESWDQNKISVLFTGKIQGQFPVKLTTDQGQSISSTCQVGLTTVNFSLTTLCANVTQQNGGYNADNVKVKIYKNVPEADASAPSISQTIRVTGGQVQSFAPSLEANKDYSMLIKAPKSPQKRLDFHTQSGTTDLGVITLRIGDIAPINNPDGDGFVNAVDISELYREWSINRDVGTIGDVNGDSRVNSVDYSCVKQNYDASKGNDTFSPPASVAGAGAGTGTGGGSNAISISTKGRVFIDANANKMFDSGETLSPNVTVQLLKVPDSHVVGQPLNSSELAQSNILAQTTTDSNGAFRINFNAVNQNLKLSFYVQASAGTNNSPGQVDGSGQLQSLNNLSTNIQLGGIDIPVPYVGVLNMNVSQL